MLPAANLCEETSQEVTEAEKPTTVDEEEVLAGEETPKKVLPLAFSHVL
jgi:hypothetical protein